MMTSYSRGHKIYFDIKDSNWKYLDDNSSIEYERPCKRCGKLPTKEGYDNCLGHIEKCVAACCGHGVEEPYIMKNDNKE